MQTDMKLNERVTIEGALQSENVHSSSRREIHGNATIDLLLPGYQVLHNNEVGRKGHFARFPLLITTGFSANAHTYEHEGGHTGAQPRQTGAEQTKVSEATTVGRKR